MKQWIYRSPLLIASVFAALSSCGKQSYGVVQSLQDSGPAGATSIAPKVDILLAVDNSGSTIAIQNQLNASIRGFLTQLNNQNWDFRIAAIPLVTAVPLAGTSLITRISASKYDANTGAGWVPPYPGAPSTSTIPHSMFTLPSDFQVTLNSGTTDGKEPGLYNIGAALASDVAQNNFLRKEAILAVVVISNGDDSSDAVDYSAYPWLPPRTVSQSLIDSIRNSKGSALSSSVNLIPVVSNGSRSCFGETSTDAVRYRDAGSRIGNQSSINLCANSMTSVLTQLQTQLSAIKLNYVKRFIQLNSRPNEDTIQVVKKLENGQAINVPKSVSGSDGWVYLGEATRPMVSEPIEMDFRTGYMIQLIGDAYKLTGAESASVTFLPYNIKPSSP